MEFYVRALVESLEPLVSAQMVICAKSFIDVNAVNVVELGIESLGNRRSLVHQLRSFSVAVGPIISELKNQGYIVHSHERICGHDVSTQHGPLIEPTLLSILSPKYKLWKKLEISELNCSAIVPVSNLLADDITCKYPMFAERLVGIGWPGMPCPDGPALESARSTRRLSELTGIRALFVGRETRRKGLAFAVDVVRAVRKLGWNMTLTLVGPEKAPADLPDFVDFLGWKERVPYEEFDLLIHPARQEPFGMCVTEAYCAGVPSFVSENVGAKGLGLEGVFDLPLSDNPQLWAKKILSFLGSRQKLSMTYRWSWEDLARFYCRDVYDNL